MANPLPAVSECGEKFPALQHFERKPNPVEYSPLLTNPFPDKKFCLRGKKK